MSEMCLYDRKWFDERFNDPNVDKRIIEFIDNILTNRHRINEGSGEIYDLFACGYCFYFAKILEIAFPGGSIVWCAPFAHIAYLYNGIVYDIHHIYDGEAEYFIPIKYLEKHISDFMHIPNKPCIPLTKEEIKRIIDKYLEDNNIRKI